MSIVVLICSSTVCMKSASSSYTASAQVLKHCRAGHLRGEFAQFTPHHVFCDQDFVVDLAIVHLKAQANKVREYCCRARLGLNRRSVLSRDWLDNWESSWASEY
ncbi:hypothetical protein MRB53_042239 [Persea americana]|nr:hypothetical protein MRB53_042239 [Persea americana]